MSKDILDEKIIGYSKTKDLLRQIVDMQNNPELYAKVHATTHGMILYGPPGTGKSTMVNCMMNMIPHRCKIIFHKDTTTNEFHSSIKEAFEKAANGILVLEDMDHYVESYNPNNEVYTTLQTLMDTYLDVFVIVTANSIDSISSSLLRRFAIKINVPIPSFETNGKIMGHYLQGKKLGKDVLISDIVSALDRSTCSTLEGVIRVASMHATYDRSDVISKQNIIDAILEVKYGLKCTDDVRTDDVLQEVIIHECAHCVVAEAYFPGNVSLLTHHCDENDSGGLTSFIHNVYASSEDFIKNVTVGLAGMAGIDVVMGVQDMGAGADNLMVLNLLINWLTKAGGLGMTYVEHEDIRSSDDKMRNIEIAASTLMTVLYQDAKKIIIQNRDFLDALCKELKNNGTLLASDIRRIKNSHSKKFFSKK